MSGDEIRNVSDNAAKNAAIRNAINLFDIVQARTLLREALPHADGETYYLASLVALNDRQKRDFLQKAVATDPFHADAFAALEQLINPPSSPAEAPVQIIPVQAAPPVLSPPGPSTEPSFLQYTPSIATPSPYAPPVLTVASVQEPIPLGPSITTPSSPIKAVTLASNAVEMASDVIPTEPVNINDVEPASSFDEPSADLVEMLTTPTPPGGIAIQNLQQVVNVPVSADNNARVDKDYVRGIVQMDTPLYVIPDRRGSIRAQLLAYAEVILLARTDDSRWVNVIWLSSINKEALGWLPLSTIRSGYVQDKSVNMIDLPITKYEYNDTAHLIALQAFLQQEKWDRLRRSPNLVMILFGVAFCSFFFIDAAVGTRVPLDYVSITLGIALIIAGFVRWWIGIDEIRKEWQSLDMIRRRKQATDEAMITQQANAAALKLASEMIMALLRSQSENER